MSLHPTHARAQLIEDKQAVEAVSESKSLGRVLINRDWQAAVGQMSALPPEADIRQRIGHVCNVPQADVALGSKCRFEPPGHCAAEPADTGIRLLPSSSLPDTKISS
jgi:hypothetical protein